VRGRHKKWAAPFLSDHPEIVFAKIDPQDPFFSDGPLYLEIGIGKGDFIIGMSSLLGGKWLGLERDLSIMGSAAKKAVESGKANIRLRAADFDFCFEEMAGLSFDAIFLNFSDPWPKKKHWKRRLTTTDRLLKMKALLKERGLVYFKSDNQNLYDFTLEEAKKAGYQIVSSTGDYQCDPLDVPTEYEKNFRSLNTPITRIILRK